MTNLRAAAERLRRWKSGETQSAVWGHPSNWDSNKRQMLRNADAMTLALAYLAEHDPTPIDETWLLSVGFTFGHKWKNGFGYCELKAGCDTITVSTPNDSGDWTQEEWMVGGERIPHGAMPATRGDVIRLCRALGIELKE